MISKKELEKIQKLKLQGLTVSQIARTLGISRPTVLKYLGDAIPSKENPNEDPVETETSSEETHAPLTFDDLFEMDRCERCKTLYPIPKFLPEWKCPYCKVKTSLRSVAYLLQL